MHALIKQFGQVLPIKHTKFSNLWLALFSSSTKPAREAATQDGNSTVNAKASHWIYTEPVKGPKPSYSNLTQIFTSSPASNSNKLILRDFIQNSLYHPVKGYFSSSSSPVGTLKERINYKRISCKAEYRYVVSQKYKDLQVAFLTPAELFTPAFGGSLGRYISEHYFHTLQLRDTPINVVEIGGGNGTLARDVLDWFKSEKPAEYERVTYTCVEISHRLAQQQYATVVTRGGHGGHFKLMQGNAWEEAMWGVRDYTHTTVILMEVLDNLAHDRVVREREGMPWQQTVVETAQQGVPMEEGPWQESLEPLSDPLLTRCLEAIPHRQIPNMVSAKLEKFEKKTNKWLDWLLHQSAQEDWTGDIKFIPTGCLALLEILHDMRPNHTVIAADFAILPDVKIPGENAPLVASKAAGRNFDHDTIYVPWGKADIFFPTHFDDLCHIYKKAGERMWPPGQPFCGRMSAEHHNMGDMLKRYKEMYQTATQGVHGLVGFNPMIDDFINARFFIGSSHRRKPLATVPLLESGLEPEEADDQEKKRQRIAEINMKEAVMNIMQFMRNPTQKAEFPPKKEKE